MLSEQDLGLMTDEVDRFVERVIRPVIPAAEHQIEQSTVDMLLAEADHAGILGEGDENLGIWGGLHATPQFSISALQSITKASAGLAWIFHQNALKRRIKVELGVSISDFSVSYMGHYGIGGKPLVSYLFGQDKTEADYQYLKDFYDVENNYRLVTGLEGTDLIYIGIDDTIQDDKFNLVWKHKACETNETFPLKDHHGLDDVQVGQIKLSSSGSNLSMDNGLLKDLLFFDSLTIIAITQGVLGVARKAADEYSKIRKQGGKPIIQHAAVQELLSTITATEQSGQLFLDSQAKTRDKLKGLIEANRWRSHWMPQACQAANNAMQIHGGIGYMKDLGIEKVVRDCNTLRVIHGSPFQLALFSEAAEQLEALS